MIRLFGLLSLLLLTGCQRVDTRTYSFPLPEAGGLEVLQLIESTLWKEQELLPDGIRFYEAIEVTMEPSPTLRVTVQSRQLGKQNLVERLHRWGYSVEGRDGDPVKRTAFLVGAR